MLKRNFGKNDGKIFKRCKYENASLEFYINIYNLTSIYILVKDQKVLEINRRGSLNKSGVDFFS